MQQPYYAETPFERIVDVHWKTPDGGGNGGPGEPGPCGSGWFAFGGYFPGGDGFPAQVQPPPVNLAVSGGVRWNPAFAVPPEGNPYLFFIPGGGARSLILSVVWAGVLPPVTGPPLLGGIWLYPSGPPPGPQPPPDFTFDIVGDGRFDVPPDVPLSGTVMMNYAARSGVLTGAPFIASADDREPTHYGFPGGPPSEGIWIEVEHDCP